MIIMYVFVVKIILTIMFSDNLWSTVLIDLDCYRNHCVTISDDQWFNAMLNEVRAKG